MEYRIPFDRIAQVFTNPRDARAFERMQRTLGEVETTAGLSIAATNALNEAVFVTLSPNAELPNERVLEFGAGISPILTGTTVGLTADVRSNGGYRITLVSDGDAMLGTPLTGFLATREWVNSQGFGSGGGGGSSLALDGGDSAGAASPSFSVDGGTA